MGICVKKRAIYTALLPLWAVSFVAEIAPQILVPSLLGIAHSLDLSNSQATGLMSSFYLTLSLSFLLAGIFIHQLNKKTVMLTASVFILCGSAMIGYTDNYRIMILGRIIQAIGAGAITVTGQTWIGQSATEQNITKLFSSLTLFLSFAPLLAPIIGGYVYDLFSWRYNFYLVASLAAIAIIFITFTTPPPPESNEKLSFREISGEYRNLLTRTPFFAIVATTLVCFLFQGSLMSYSSFLFIGQLGLSASLFGFISVPVVAGIIIGQLPVLLLEKRKGLSAAFTFATVITILALSGSLVYYLIYGTHSIYELTAILFVFNIGFGGHNLIAIRIVMSRFHHMRSYSSALLNFFCDLSNYLAALIVQLLFILAGSTFLIHNTLIFIIIILLMTTHLVCRRYIY